MPAHLCRHPQLSYFNWTTNRLYSQASTNFEARGNCSPAGAVSKVARREGAGVRMRQAGMISASRITLAFAQKRGSSRRASHHPRLTLLPVPRTPSLQVVADPATGLCFKSKRDRKVGGLCRVNRSTKRLHWVGRAEACWALGSSWHEEWSVTGGKCLWGLRTGGWVSRSAASLRSTHSSHSIPSPPSPAFAAGHHR